MPPRKRKPAIETEETLAEVTEAPVVTPAPDPEPTPALTVDAPPAAPKPAEPRVIFGMDKKGLMDANAPVHAPCVRNFEGELLPPLPSLQLADLDHALTFVERFSWDHIERLTVSPLPTEMPLELVKQLEGTTITMWPEGAANGQDYASPYLLVGDWVVLCHTVWTRAAFDDKHCRRMAAIKGILDGPEYEEFERLHRKADPETPIRRVVAIHRQTWTIIGEYYPLMALLRACLIGMDANRFNPRSSGYVYGVPAGIAAQAAKTRVMEAFWEKFKASDYIEATPILFARRLPGCPMLDDDVSNAREPFCGFVAPQGLKLSNGQDANLSGTLKGRGAQQAEAVLKRTEGITITKPVGVWTVAGEGVEVVLSVSDEPEKTVLKAASQSKKRGDALFWDTRLALEIGNVLSAQVAREALWSLALDQSAGKARHDPWVEPAELDGKVVRKVGEQLTFADAIRNAAKNADS